MNFLTRRSGLAAVAAAIACGALAAGRRDHPADPPGLAPAAAVVTRPGTTGKLPTENRPAIEAWPVAAVPPGAPDRIEIAGGERGVIDSAALAARPTALDARDRRAWRLSELMPDTYINANVVIHALTIDGKDYIVRGGGRGGDDAIVVRRASGELYLGWLDGDGRDGRPLADAERPAERIEHVARIVVAAAVGTVASAGSAATLPGAAATAPADARVTILVDGKRRQTLTADSFAGAARSEVANPHGGTSPALDLAQAFGGALRLTDLVAGGAHVAIAPPSRSARAVLTMNRRGRFKLGWIDAAGRPIGARQREVSELSLQSVAAIAPR